jgi:4-amino-4-deoxy-L-arabinose transferase-like glycosyltransferase
MRFAKDPALPIDPDSMDYIEPALSLLETGSYGDANGQPTVRRPPGYAAILAMLFGTFGVGKFLAVVLFQNLVFYASSILVAIISLRIGGFLAMVIATALFLSHFTTFYYTNEILNETVFTFLLLGAVLCLTTGSQADNNLLGWIFCAGVILTAATFVRPVSLYLFYPLAMLLSAIFYRRFRNWRDASKAAMVFLLPWVVLGGLWYARNFSEFGRFQFVGQQSQILPERTGLLIARLENVSKFEAGKFYEKNIDENNGPIFKHLIFYANHPFQYLEMSIESVLITLFSPAQWHFSFYFPEYPTERKPFTKALFSGQFSMVLSEIQSWGVGNLLLLSVVIFQSVVLTIGAFLPLFALKLWRRQNIPILTISYVILTYMLMLVFVWGGAARFNVPNVPFLAILAGFGYSALYGWLSSAPSSPKPDNC